MDRLNGLGFADRAAEQLTGRTGRSAQPAETQPAAPSEVYTPEACLMAPLERLEGMDRGTYQVTSEDSPPAPDRMKMHWKTVFADDGTTQIRYPGGDGQWVTLSLDEARQQNIPGVRAMFGDKAAPWELPPGTIVGGRNISTEYYRQAPEDGLIAPSGHDAGWASTEFARLFEKK